MRFRKMTKQSEPVSTMTIPPIQKLSGDLTLEKWSQWNSAKVHKQLDPSSVSTVSILDLIYAQLHNHYDKISDSEWIVSNFLSLPDGLQSVLIELIKYPVEISTIESFLKLVLEFDASSDSINCAEQKYDEFSKSISDEYGDQSLKLKTAVERFRSIHGGEHVIIKGAVMTNSALMLSRLFGEDRFIEVTSVFHLQNLETDLGTFVNLVKRWDELSKYPLAWAINLAQS